MKRLLVAAAVGGALLVSEACAGLVPVPFSCSPLMERLTRSEALIHWGNNFFGQCHGIAAVPLVRFSAGDSTPFAFVAVDERRSILTFGASFEKGGAHGWIWCDQVSAAGGLSRKLRNPLGVALDTVRYDSCSTLLHSYVADGLRGTISRWALDFRGHSLSYVDDIFTGGSNVADVACCPIGLGRTAIAVLDESRCRLTVLAAESAQGPARLVSEYGTRGYGVGQFIEPVGVSITRDPDSSGTFRVYVADAGNRRVVRLRLSLETETISWLGAYTIPDGYLSDVAVGSFGCVYVTDIAENRIIALPPDLSSYLYTYDDCGFVRPVEIVSSGDELVVSEEWTDSSGIQYLRIVPEIESVAGGCTFDATCDSAIIEFKLKEAEAYVDIGVNSNGIHITRDSLLEPGRPYQFVWYGKDDSGLLLRPRSEPYIVSISAHYRRGESDSTLIVTEYVKDTIRGTSVSGPVSGYWAKSEDPYVLTDNVTICQYSSLQIEPCVRVLTLGCQELAVEGSLSACGTDTSPIAFGPYRRFLPETDSASPGSWQGIRIGSLAESHATLDHCIIEYGGNPGGDAQDSAMIVCMKPGGLSLTNSILRYSLTRGVWGGGTELLDNYTNYLANDSFQHIAGYPAAVRADSVHSIVHSCGFSDNGTPALEVHSISSHELSAPYSEWLKKEPNWRYDLVGSLHLYGPDQSTCTLRIGPGVTVRSGDNVAIGIGLANSSSRRGVLLADGSTEPIAFTQMFPSQPSKWSQGIRVNDSSCCFLDSCEVYGSTDKAIWLGSGSDATIRQSLIHGATTEGLYLNGASASLVGDRFQDNLTGVSVATSNGFATIQDCWFENNSDYGLSCQADQGISPTGCTFTGNDIPARVQANKVAEIVAGNSFDDNSLKGLEVTCGTNAVITSSVTWPALPELHKYRCIDDVIVREASDRVEPEPSPDRPEPGQGRLPIDGAGPDAARLRPKLEPGEPQVKIRPGIISPRLTAFSMPTLTLEPGDTLEFAEQKALRISDYLKPANLYAVGTKDKPIVFGCYESGKYWNGIQLDRSPSSVLKHCLVSRAGYNDEFGGIDCSRSNALIERCEVSGGQPGVSLGFRVYHCSTTVRRSVAQGCSIGVHVKAYDDELVNLDSCSLSGNRLGIVNNYKGTVGIHHSNIAGNSPYGAFSDGHSTLNAQNNWWGSASGPNPPGAGDNISAYVDAGSYLAASVEVEPGFDIEALLPIAPVGLIVSDTPVTVIPSGKVTNHYDEAIACPIRLTIGTVDTAETLLTVQPYQTVTVSFPSLVLSRGAYPVVFGVHVNGDQNHANDSLIDTVEVRPRYDAAALRPLVPSGAVLSETAITVVPSGLVANLYDQTLLVPVHMQIGGTYGEDSMVQLAAHETLQVSFPRLQLSLGWAQVIFATGLSVDELPANDTIIDSVLVWPNMLAFQPKTTSRTHAAHRLARNPVTGAIAAAAEVISGYDTLIGYHFDYSKPDSNWYSVGQGTFPELAFSSNGTAWLASLDHNALKLSALRPDTTWNTMELLTGSLTLELGPPSLALFKGSSGRLAQIALPARNTATGSALIFFIQADTMQKVLDTAEYRSGATAMPECHIEAGTADSVRLVFTRGDTVMLRRLVFGNQSGGRPDTWSAPSRINDTLIQADQPFCENVKDRLYVAFRARNAIGTETDYSIQQASCLNSDTTIVWEGLGPVSAVDTIEKDNPVLSGSKVTAWTELGPTPRIMAVVDDSLLCLTPDTSAQACALLCDSSVRNTPSTNMIRTRYLRSQLAGPDWRLCYDSSDVHSSDAVANVTQYSAGAKLAIDGKDTLHAVFRSNAGSLYYCQAADGAGGWNSTLLRNSGELPALALDYQDRLYVADRTVEHVSGGYRDVIRCQNRAPGSSTWNDFMVYSVPVATGPGAQPRLGPPSIAACASDTGGLGRTAAYIAFALYTPGTGAQSSIVLTKVDTSGVIRIDTIHTVRGDFSDSLPCVAVRPVPNSAYGLHLVWQTGPNAMTSAVDYAKSLNLDQPEFTTKRTWSAVYGLGYSGRPRHATIACDADSVVAAWVAGDSTRVLARGQADNSPYNAWSDTVNISSCPDTISDWPVVGVGLGDSILVSYQKKISPGNYDVITRVNFHSNLNVSANSTNSTYPHCLFHLHQDSIPLIEAIWSEELSPSCYETGFRRYRLGDSPGFNAANSSIFDPSIVPMLFMPWPNPSHTETHIRYQINRQGTVQLSIYDLTGRRIRTLVTGTQKPGIYDLLWNRTDNRNRTMSNGIYFLRISAPALTSTRKLVVE